MNSFIVIKAFLILSGIWNLFDGIISIKLENLGHTKLSDLARLARSLIGIGLILIGLYLK